MKFNVKWFLAAFVALLAALAAAPWTVSQNAQILAIESQIAGASGMRLASHGRSVFAVLPRPHIRIYDAELEQGSGGMQISTSSLRVDLGLAGLLTGRLELARAILADAVFTIDLAHAFFAPAGQTPGGVGSAPEMALGEVQVVGGKLLLRRPGAEKTDLAAEAIEARLDWSRAGAPLSLIGHCQLPAFGENRPPARFALWAAQPDQWPRGKESKVTLRVDADAFQIDINGALALAPRPHFKGRVSGAAPSLRQAAQWLDLTLPLPGRYGALSIKGEAILDPDLIAFPAIAVSIDGNALDGAASIRLDGQRPLISATLAGASVNLEPLIEALPAASASGQWSHEIFWPSHLAAADLDLRLSAAHARLGDFQFDDAALSAILKNGRLDLSLAQASAYSGQVRARAIIAENAGGLDIRGSAFAEKVDVAALLWDGFKRQSLSGTARATLSFETSGDSWYELASRLDARGELAVEKGEIYGLDLSLAFRRMERRPLTAGVELRSGRTAFEQLGAKFGIQQGQADVEEGFARGERLTANFSGKAQIAERTVDLRAVASHQPPGDPDAKPLQLGFNLSGAWDDATLVPDALGLIHRSDAAAPLLPKKPAPN
ncbi:AsmA-like C-terminal region-containing protein [uncultured Rhodoblastus sp.]|uniref:AsmA family protein n=1 Tax=uncultured Rhodoblastus sp. TaxID=543037 RepID=UPI0025F38762|nr:AsmA-like C-terminal region-containing protein [uncultured Rhodoblastus sp.]